MENIVVIGAGGHAKVVIDILLKDSTKNIVGILDDGFEKLKYRDIFGINILGKVSELKRFPKDYSYIIAIGNRDVRDRIVKKYPYLKYINAISPRAYIANGVEIGVGTVISHNAVINPDTKIGNHCIINTGAVVEHDTLVGDLSHIAPGVTICGGVTIGRGCWIGAKSVVIEGKSIGENCMIGAGSVIVRDVEKNSKVYGNPGRVVGEI